MEYFLTIIIYTFFREKNILEKFSNIIKEYF